MNVDRRYRRLPLLVLLAVALSGQGLMAGEATPQAELDKCFLWEVRSGDRLAYVLGSVHVGLPEMYPLNPAINDAFAASAVLALEVDLTPEGAGKMMMQLAQKGYYPEGETLADHIGEETLSRTKDALRSLRLPYSGMQRMRPWLLMVTLTLAKCATEGYQQAMGLDQHFLGRALKEEKPVVGIEDMDKHLDVLAGEPPETQEKMLQQGIEELKDIVPYMKRTLQAWQQGDGKGIEDLIREALAKDKDLQGHHKRLFDDRNVIMADAIETYLKTETVHFVVVGAGHLVGPKGIVKLLTDRKYRVRQIEKKPVVAAGREDFGKGDKPGVGRKTVSELRPEEEFEEEPAD